MGVAALCQRKAALRQRKVALKARSREAAAQRKFKRLLSGWNRIMIREGDKAYDGLKCGKRPHGNRLSTEGFVRVAWRSIGRREWAGRHGDVLSTTHAPECLSSLAAIAKEAQESAMLECGPSPSRSRSPLRL